MSNDPVNPSHYSRFKIQPAEFVRANPLGYDVGCIIKYICRHDAKNGKEDLLKAKQYLEWMIEDFYPEPPKEGLDRYAIPHTSTCACPLCVDPRISPR